VALVARGDEEAFAELYRRVGAAVFGLVGRVVRDPAQSEEVAQEVFVELWRTASRFDPARGTARAWIMTCAHRRAVDRVRSAESAARRDDLAGRRDQVRPYDEVVEQVEASLDREHVRRSLDALTELQREALVLAYYGGYTHREIAELLGVPSGTVKTRLRDGLIRLRDHLGVEA
jgi:RNA polymerase sigma-70 factor, ECF subfamily